jgi:hypothetical protein
MDRKKFASIAQQAEDRMLRGGQGSLPEGFTYVLIVHETATGLTVPASNLSGASMVSLMLDTVQSVSGQMARSN